jgi:hypothetical protein
MEPNSSYAHLSQRSSFGEVTRMAIYRLSADAYLKYAGYKWKACLVFASFVVAAILCSHFESVGRYPQLAEILPHLYSVTVIGVIFSFGSIFACYYAPKIVMTMEISLTAEGVFRSGGGAPNLFFPWADVTGYIERKHSILIRTMDPNRCLSISSDFERYAEIKTELASRGIGALRRDEIHLSQNPGLVLALASVVLLLFGQYIGWRNRFRHKSRTLPVLFLFLAGEIVMLFPRSRGDAWELSYLALNGVLGLVAYGISAFREKHQ